MSSSQILAERVRSYSVILALITVILFATVVFGAEFDSFWPGIERMRSDRNIVNSSGEQVSIHGLFNSITDAPIRIRGGFEGERFCVEPSEIELKNFIDEHINKCTELNIEHLATLEQKLEAELINEYLIYPKGYRREIPNAISVIKEEIHNKQSKIKTIEYDKNEDEIVFEQIVHNEFIEVRGLYANSTEHFINNIIPNFKRQVNDQDQMTIPINLSLPIDEITEYLKVVKKKAKIKSPLELLHEELKEADNLTNLNTTNKKGQEYIIDATNGDNPQQKLADMLYIYDMKQKGYSHADIIYELDIYYPNKQTATSDNTIKKYFTIADEYIKYKRYKELITGKIEKK